MPDRIKPRAGMVLKFYPAADMAWLPARIAEALSDTRANITYTEAGEEKSAADIELIHALDPMPTEGPFAQFHPRPDVASERALLADKPAQMPEPEPEPTKSEERRQAHSSLKRKR